MNEDGEPPQDGVDENLDESVQKMLDDLKKLLAQKKSKTLITSVKQKFVDLCEDVDSANNDLANTSNSSSMENHITDTIVKSEDIDEQIVKKEPEDIIGKIKVKNLSLLLDPSRQTSQKETIVLSDSDEENTLQSNETTTIDNTSNAAVDKNDDNDTVCDNDNSTLTKSDNSLDCTNTSPKEKLKNNKTVKNNKETKSSETSTKSILKNCITKSPSPEKKVKFSKKDAEIHTYMRYSSASDSSSDGQSSDEEFTIKTIPKKKSRNRVVQQKETNNVQYPEHIRQDKKYFSKCVVNVNRVSIGNLSNLINKGDEESRTDEVKRMNIMDGLKRKRKQNGTDSDAEENTRKQKKSKRDKKSSTEAENKNNSEKNGKTKKSPGKFVVSSDDSDEAEETINNDNLPTDDNTSDHSQEDVVSDDEDFDNESNANSKKTDSDSEEETITTAQPKKKKTKAKRVISDSEESGSGSETAENSTSAKLLDESDESDEESNNRSAKKTKKRSRIKKIKDSSDEEEEVTTRKQIRKLISRDSLADTTKQAERDEAERKARIAERQAKYNHIFDPKDLESDVLSKVVLDFNEETQEELLSVDSEFVKHLKPHQAKGIQFMWNACFESLERAKKTDGGGCILAHCMGLGKTLQVVTLTHTLLASSDKTGVMKVLVVCPLSTVLNWVSEYKQWLPDDDEVQVYNLIAYKQNRERVVHIMDWHKNGGVLILGYDMFRNLSNEANKRVTKKMRQDFCKALVDPGPDLVVCDEGHLLKNGNTSLSKAMNRIKSLRRIILTGTPLQNNLKEYHCMVQFVKPNLLGTYKEYLNRFVNPITNGQYTDSTQADINLMRKRSHVLHKLLDGTVQRRDYAVLAPFLPPKYEYVVFISLTATQRNLYEYYLANFAQRATAGGRTALFADFQELQRICTHPRVLLDKSIQNKALADKKWDDEEEEDSEGSLKNFIDDSDSESEAKSTSSSDSDNSDKPAPNKFKRRTRATAENEPEEVPEEIASENTTGEWWAQFTESDELDNIIHSGKLSLLFEILHQCELIGDKILVFSQSLLSLNVIEYFLARIDEATQNGDSKMVKGYTGSWSLGLDYFRLDGSSSCDNRASWCKTFNDPNNTRARLFLISTRAGGLGINLVAANRVIIFDVSWNPSHDIQSIYRVYRFGQIKPSYIYRFVTLGTMEMKVYERQVTKQAISKRVIDEQQIDRHYNQNDLQELYKFEPEPSARPPSVPPKDILLGELLQNFEDVIFKYHEHQSLLENKEDEVLNEDERKAAWEEFENEKKMQRNSTGTINNIPMHLVVQALKSILMREHPNITAQELNGVMPQVINDLRTQMAAGEMATFNKMLNEIKAIKAAEQARVQEYFQQQQQRGMWLAQIQRQFPALNPADIERFMRSQMANMGAYSNLPSTAPPARPRTAAPNVSVPPINISSEIVNLDED